MNREKQKAAADLGERLRRIRLAYGDAQHDLAIVLECTRASISQWEAGKTRPDPDKLKRIIEHYKVPSDWLQWGKGDAPSLPEPGRRRHRALDDPGRGAAPPHNPGTPIEYFTCPHCPPAPSGEWVIPAYALPTQPATTNVFRSTDEIGPIKHGDYILLDRTQLKIHTRGFWLVQLEDVAAPVIVRSRVGKRGNKSRLEICMADDLAFDIRSVKVVHGRIVGKFSLIG